MIKNRKNPVSTLLMRLGTIRWILRERRTWPYFFIHRTSVTEHLPGWLVLSLVCGKFRGALSCPDNLTIVLVHDMPKEPIMARSLRYVGISDFLQLAAQPNNNGWHGTAKLMPLYNAIADGTINTEYILHCDSNDAVICGDPYRLIDYFEKQACDLLFSNTKITAGYQHMPDVYSWANKNLNGHFLNSGVYIGRRDFLLEVLREAAKYITKDETPRTTYSRLLLDNGKKIADFPLGIGSDQIVFRYIQPQFHPRLKIDRIGHLALR